MPTPTATPTATELPERLRLAVTRLARRLRQQSDDGASPTQLAALATIERKGPITLGDLATCERVQPPTITATIGRLAQLGLVQRRPDATDRRITRVEIAPAGRKLLARNRKRKTAYLSQRLSTLDAADRATLSAAADILDRLLEEETEQNPARRRSLPGRGTESTREGERG